MKKLIAAIILIYAFFALTGCVSAPISQSADTDIMSLDWAMDAAASLIEERVAAGSETAVYKITAYNDEIGNFIADELIDRLTVRGKLTLLARETALQYVDEEHQFQMTGLVSDESAVGIGHYLGAKVVVTGTFDRYAGFTQFRLRAIDVRTSVLIAAYTARISNNDDVLASITDSLPTMPEVHVSEDALTHLNRGKDFRAEGKLDDAIREFDRAIAINNELAEAYFQRGWTYRDKRDYDHSIADLEEAIRFTTPDNARRYGMSLNHIIREAEVQRSIGENLFELNSR